MDARQVAVSPSHEYPCRNRYEATQVQLPGAGVRAPAWGMSLMVTTRTPTTRHTPIARMLILSPLWRKVRRDAVSPFRGHRVGGISSSAIPTDGAPSHSGSGRG